MPRLRASGLMAMAAITVVACDRSISHRQLDGVQAEAIRDSVQQFTAAIAEGLSRDGPIAWLRYFEDNSAFFMASDGDLVFPSIDSATAFVQLLSGRVSAIELEWVDVRVEPLAPGIAVIGASYRESITDTAGAEITFGGFMTGVANHTAEGWRLRNLHWSSPVQAPE